MLVALTILCLFSPLAVAQNPLCSDEEPSIINGLEIQVSPNSTVKPETDVIFTIKGNIDKVSFLEVTPPNKKADSNFKISSPMGSSDKKGCRKVLVCRPMTLMF
eukprot:TRINITY_DN38425_c0_g1_i1.p2 TRINITY_DN38425_c0_g1~~TRINITY_DN38425_c0_g1_i1.p2  ORF type:complete len:104 (-),score=1.02 TRINITY_DN38425_c0_g1_i1:3-314(-)